MFKFPKTGDGMMITPAVMLMMASAILLIVLFICSKKKEKEHEQVCVQIKKTAVEPMDLQLSFKQRT